VESDLEPNDGRSETGQPSGTVNEEIAKAISRRAKTPVSKVGRLSCTGFFCSDGYLVGRPAGEAVADHDMFLRNTAGNTATIGSYAKKYSQSVFFFD